MAFSDMDAAAEIAKLSNQIAAMSGQLTTALVQIAEMRGEQSAMRRDMDRLLAERRTSDAANERERQMSQQTQPLAGWSVLLLLMMAGLIVGMVVLAIYVGGRGGL